MTTASEDDGAFSPAIAGEEHEAYQRQGYVALPGLFGRDVMAMFHAQLNLDLGLPGQSARYMTHGPLLAEQAIEIYGRVYPAMLYFLWGLTPRMPQVAGCALLPTYCYFRIYQQGDICRVHSDRAACEHSLSLIVTLSDRKPWALAVDIGRTAVPRAGVDDDFGGASYGSAAMNEGDAVMYQGVHHRHGRLDPNPNEWSAHLFKHWVDAAGPYRDQAFDRPTLRQAGMLQP